MTFELVTVPCLEDNYAFIVHEAETNTTLLVDVPEADPIRAALSERGWTLTHVLFTHHHWDHVDGWNNLRKTHSAITIGAQADEHRLPALDMTINDGDTIQIGSEVCQVFDVSGHTVGHIAVYMPTAKIVFTADSLMALGCGRLFEGTPAQMWESLCKLMSLPKDTLVCSGHEYTTGNAKFAITVDPDNIALRSRMDEIQEKRAKNIPTVPSLLSEELATNPFLRADDHNIRKTLGMLDESDAQVFARIRQLKDNF